MAIYTMHTFKVHQDNHFIVPNIVSKLESIGHQVSVESYYNIIIHNDDVCEDEVEAIKETISYVISEWQREKTEFLESVKEIEYLFA